MICQKNNENKTSFHIIWKGAYKPLNEVTIMLSMRVAICCLKPVIASDGVWIFDCACCFNHSISMCFLLSTIKIAFFVRKQTVILRVWNEVKKEANIMILIASTTFGDCHFSILEWLGKNFKQKGIPIINVIGLNSISIEFCNCM